MSTAFDSERDREAYRLMVLRVVLHFSPQCSDYQVWRGIFSDPLDAKYPHAINQVLQELAATCDLTVRKEEGFPHNVYSITEQGRKALESATQ